MHRPFDKYEIILKYDFILGHEPIRSSTKYEDILARGMVCASAFR